MNTVSIYSSFHFDLLSHDQSTLCFNVTEPPKMIINYYSLDALSFVMEGPEESKYGLKDEEHGLNLKR